MTQFEPSVLRMFISDRTIWEACPVIPLMEPSRSVNIMVWSPSFTTPRSPIHSRRDCKIQELDKDNMIDNMGDGSLTFFSTCKLKPALIIYYVLVVPLYKYNYNVVMLRSLEVGIIVFPSSQLVKNVHLTGNKANSQ